MASSAVSVEDLLSGTDISSESWCGNSESNGGSGGSLERLGREKEHGETGLIHES
jgi:hypothetical protein